MHLPRTSLLDLLCVIYEAGGLPEGWEEEAGSNEALDTPVYVTANDSTSTKSLFIIRLQAGHSTLLLLLCKGFMSRQHLRSYRDGPCF